MGHHASDLQKAPNDMLGNPMQAAGTVQVIQTCDECTAVLQGPSGNCSSKARFICFSCSRTKTDFTKVGSHRQARVKLRRWEGFDSATKCVPRMTSSYLSLSSAYGLHAAHAGLQHEDQNVRASGRVNNERRTALFDTSLLAVRSGKRQRL